MENHKENILLISPDTFGYYLSIGKAFSDRGANVTWLNQIPSTNVITRILFRLLPSIGAVWSDRYFEKKIDWKCNYDHVVVIKGEGLSRKILKKLRSNLSKANMVFYTWDSVVNTRGVLGKLEYFDKTFSFDPKDCERYGGLEHLPLFYERSNESDLHENNDLCAMFVGTLHGDRYRLVEELSMFAEKVLKKPRFVYYYSPKKWIFYLKRLVKKSFSGISSKEIKFKPLSKSELFGVLRNSEVVIDICHPHQSGLTMRTIEAIAMRKKLITNNVNIKNYDFYHADNVYILENNRLDGLKCFLTGRGRITPDEIIKRYSVGAWVNCLLR